MKMLRVLKITAALAMALLLRPVAAFDIGANSSLVTVALSGQPAPDTGGREFSQFDRAEINDLGDVTFFATLGCCGSNGTIYSTGTGSLRLVAWSGSPAEPGGIETFRSFNEFQIDNLGRTLIHSEMFSLPNDFDAVYAGQANEMLTRIMVSGQLVDPNDPDTTYRRVDFPQLAMGGALAGRAVSITNGQISPSSDVLYRSNGNELATSVLRVGDQIDFLPIGVEIGFRSEAPFNNPVINDAGQIAVRVATVDTRIGPNAQFGQHILLIQPDDTYTGVVSSGEFVPASANLPSSTRFSTPALPVLNNRGDVAFGALIIASSIPVSDSIWFNRFGGEPELVARERTQPPGMPGVFFDNLYVDRNSEMPIWVNDEGNVAFLASLTGAPLSYHPSESVWIGAPGNLTRVLIEGDVAPGTGGVFAGLSSSDGDLVRDMAMNNRSQLAIRASYSVVPGDLRYGLFATDLDGELQKIVVPGDLLEVLPGQFRQVADIAFSSDQYAKRGTGFNDLGQVTFWARFTDGTQGIFISNAVAVPEPSTTALSLIAMVALTFFRPRQTKRAA